MDGSGFMLDMILRVVLAGILAGIIGLERELRSKDAGLKTHFLVGIGSALIMIVSKYGFYDVLGQKGISLDPSRVAAQVVSGIGFLGAGTIIFEQHSIKGLTTAAGLWATAGIGLALGAGMYPIGLFSTLLVLVGLEILDRVFKATVNKYVDINILTNSEKLSDITATIDGSMFSVVKFKSKRITDDNSQDTIMLQVKLRSTQKENIYDLINELYKNKNIIKIDVPQ